jgi:hypothetical protein
MKTEEPL